MDHRAIPPRPDLPYFDQPSIDEPDRPRRRRGRRLLAAALAGLLLLAGIGIDWNLTRGGTLASPTSTHPAGTANTNLNMQTTAKRVEPAVVDIYTYTHPGICVGNASGNDQGQLTPLGAATGMVLTSSGEVLTNNHVVDGAYSIKVTIPNRSGTFKADVVGVDPSSDVALLQLEGVSGLPTVTTVDSSSLTVGQDVIAIGNALGKGGPPTVTGGVIAALDRSITASDPGRGSEHLSGLIQTDAEIRPGDSGGPLVDATGHVIGMITAGSANDSTGVPSNVGFAITTSAALDIVNQIRAGEGGPTIFLGQVGFLGVGLAAENLDAATAARLGLSVSSGALVECVVPAGPAETAGIRSNSVITAVDGTTIASKYDLGPALHVHGVGDQVRVTWVNKSGTHTSLVTLTTGPAA